MNKEELFYIQSNTTKIEAGKVLMSEPFLNSYYFERSTVLIIDHNENEGTLGILLNKKLPLGINDIIKDFPKFDGDVYLGGPVSSDSIFYLHTLGEHIPESTEICDGIFWGGNFNAVKALIKNGLIQHHEIRFYVGYCGWDCSQLHDELENNSWLVGRISSKMILHTHPSNMWKSFVKSMGKKYQLWDRFPINPNDN